MAVIAFAPMSAQTCASPSNSATINLGAALTGRTSFRTHLTTGTTMGYTITDGTVYEEGYGTLTHGTPDTLTRTVTRNSSGNTSRIVFPGSATVISFPPSQSVVMLDTSNNLALPGTLGVTGAATLSSTLGVTGAATFNSTIAATGAITAANGTTGSQVVNFSQFAQDNTGPGYITFPGGLMFQWGPVDVTTDGSGNATFNFPAAFPSGCQTVIVANGNATGSTSVVHLIGFSGSQAQVLCPTALSVSYRVAYLAIGK